jgi:hypothetical protein
VLAILGAPADRGDCGHQPDRLHRAELPERRLCHAPPSLSADYEKCTLCPRTRQLTG